jgi:hypothetical protein
MRIQYIQRILALGQVLTILGLGFLTCEVGIMRAPLSEVFGED